MESKEVFVKAHTRIIKQKVYRFVCKGCNLVVERTCYPSRPLFCQRCRPPKTHSSKPEPTVTRSKSKASKKSTIQAKKQKTR